MKNINEVLRSTRPETPETKGYRNRLKDMRLDGLAVEIAVSASLGLPYFDDNLVVSRGAIGVVEQAQAVGIDPVPVLIKAAHKAQEEGRKKVGVFGEQKTIFSAIQQKINHRRVGLIYGFGPGNIEG